MVKLTATQVANILAEPYGAERDQIPETILLPMNGAANAAPGAREVARSDHK